MKGLVLIYVITLRLAVNSTNINFSDRLVFLSTFTAPFQTTKPAHFPGGFKAFGKFLLKNLKWPNQDDVQGRVVVAFTVEKDGTLNNIKVVKSLGKPFDNEALRVIRKSPNWIPATRNGNPIKSIQSVPINFTISE